MPKWETSTTTSNCRTLSMAIWTMCARCATRMPPMSSAYSSKMLGTVDLGMSGRTVGNAFESCAFSVVRRSCATGNYSFGHELGHNMGATHDWYPMDVGAYPYSHGFVKVTPTAPAMPWRTVMAYRDECLAAGLPDCTRVQYFSNPNVNYPVGGDAMGVANGP